MGVGLGGGWGGWRREKWTGEQEVGEPAQEGRWC